MQERDPEEPDARYVTIYTDAAMRDEDAQTEYLFLNNKRALTEYEQLKEAGYNVTLGSKPIIDFYS